MGLIYPRLRPFRQFCIQMTFLNFVRSPEDFCIRFKSARSDIEAIFGLNSPSVFEEESF